MSKRTPPKSTDDGKKGDGKNGYEVGYRRPPAHYQFRPGQSGNPAGRRKGVRNLATDELEPPDEAPVCAGVGRTSTKPCANWQRRGRRDDG